MTIKYVKDEKIEHRAELVKGLVAYNNTFAGGAPSDTFNIYAIEKDQVIAGCHTEMEWNWVFIEALFYEDSNALTSLMNEIYSRYEGKVEGVIYESYIPKRIEEFETLGFETLGSFENKPLGHDSKILINKKLLAQEHSNNHQLEMTKDVHKVYGQVVVDGVKKYNELNGIDDGKKDIEYVAYDGENIIGGVHGYIKQDYFYTSILWVDEAYRGQNIASELMNLIEDDAEAQGIKQFYLGTCTFQAEDFYKKRGYSVKMVITNCPKGYDDYTMVKYI